MSFDGIVLRTVAVELAQKLTGARIDKIYQPLKQQIILTLRQQGCSYKLLLSAQAQEARAHLVSQTPANPPEPPLFCMVLRKHLEGGKILSITQQNLERVLEINCEVPDELGEKTQRKIVIEIMGKHSNILLLAPEQNKIIDAIQRVPASVSRYRQVLPNLPYLAPPPQDKIIPWETEPETFYAKIMELPLSTPLNKALLKITSGISPQSSKEIVFRTGLNFRLTLEYCGEYELSSLWRELSKLGSYLAMPSFSPEVILEKNTPLAFSAFPLTSFSPKMRHSFPSMNEALDYFYLHKNKATQFQQKRTELESLVKKEIQRCEKKAGLQQETILEAQKSEQYRLWGELLTANLYNLKQGQEAKVTNYYDPAEKIEIIPLDEHLSISDNAQRYFTHYQKAKKAAIQAKKYLKETQAELTYLSSLICSLNNVTSLTEIAEIREEFQEAGYLKTPPKIKKNKNSHPSPSHPQKLVIGSWLIYFGKNNKQNDLLTMKLAKADDLWFHTKDIPGSHVVIKNPDNKPIPDQILEEAAGIAAYHSQARNSTNIPVDYTQRKNVWKPKGAKPGLVLYDNQHTIFVTPDAEKIEAMIANAE